MDEFYFIGVVMSELLGSDKLDSHVMKQDIMKDEFGWEIPVESVPLPSKGTVYSPDTTLYNRETIKIKAMTAHEEDILSSQAFIKEGTVVNHLIKSCVTDKSFDVNDLILGDRNALMVSIRITGYGSDYGIIATCPKCLHKNNINIDLTSLKINRLNIKPLNEGENKFKFKLPVTKKEVVFKFLTMKDEIDKSISEKNMKNILNSKINNTITNFLMYSIVSIDGVTDKNKLRHFIKNMPAYDSKALRRHINDNEPGIDMSSILECKNCSNKTEISVPITSEFFWPST